MKKIIIATLLLFSLISESYSKTYKIAIILTKGDTPFWTLVGNFAEEAANDLGLKLKIYDAKLNHFRMIRQLQEAVSGPEKVDAVVFANFKKRAPELIKIIEKAKVPAMLFLAGIGEENKEEMGVPREKFKYWIGEMLQNDEDTAMKLTSILIEDAKSKGKVDSNGKVHLIGISGMIADRASIVRVNGLRKAIGKMSDAILHQVAPTDYGQKEGKVVFLGLLNRYPQTTTVWSASYRITDGIIEGIRERKLIPGKDIITNSVVLNEDALKKVKSGELVATAGGHYIQGAWAMILLYDYLHDIDFAKESTQIKTPMVIATKDNVDLYLKNITKEKLSKKNLSKIDFTQYSKKLNPGLMKYKLSFDSVIDQL